MDTNASKTSATDESPDADGLTPALSAAREGEILDESTERKGLAFLLAPEAIRLTSKVPVDIETEAGIEKFIFFMQQLDATDFEKLEREARDATTGELDQHKFNCHVAGASVTAIRDPSGATVKTGSPQWVVGLPPKEGYTAKAVAMDARFKYQSGLLDGLNQSVQRMSGYGGGRVGVAERSLVEAGKG